MEDDELCCPLCCEEIAPVDKYFFPCPCGYQICRFCWNHIREDHNQLCPACRRQFDDDGVQFRPVPPDELAKLNADRKRRAKRTKGGSTSLLGLDVDRSHLKDSKVYQRSLVYVTGLPPKYANEDLLRSDGYFGQFGRILKLTITRRPPQTIGGKTGENQIGVHVTFASPSEAARAIQYVEGSVIENRVLHATFGTNKYCPAWLVGRQCGTVGCSFLHEVTESADPATVPTVKTGTGGPPRYFGPRGRKPATAAGSGPGALSAPPDAADAQPPVSVPVHRPSPAPPERTRSPATSGGAALPPTVNWATRKPDTPRPITPTNGVSPILSHRLFPDLSAAAAKPPEPKTVSARTVQRKPSVPAHLTADTAASPTSVASTPPPAPATPTPPRIKPPKPEKPPVVEYEEPQPETRKQQLARVLALERQRAQEQQLAVDEDETPPESTPPSSHATRPPSPDVPLPPLDLGAYILATPPDRVPAVAYAGGVGTPAVAIQPAVVTPWMLASALVLLNAMARPTDPDVYAGPFRPLDTGDLMHDIMEDRTVLAAPGGRNERVPKIAPHPAAVPVAPAAAPMSRHASLVALLNGHAGRTGGLHTPSPPPQQQQMPAMVDVFKQMLMRGQAQQQGPMASQMQQQQQQQQLQAMHPSLHSDLLMRSRSPAPNPAGVAGIPFHDPAIMSVRMDYHQPLPQRPPTSSTTSTATTRGATPTMLQRLQESLAGKAPSARMTPPPAPAPTSTPPVAGPPPGFGPKLHGVTASTRHCSFDPPGRAAADVGGDLGPSARDGNPTVAASHAPPAAPVAVLAAATAAAAGAESSARAGPRAMSRDPSPSPSRATSTANPSPPPPPPRVPDEHPPASSQPSVSLPHAIPNPSSSFPEPPPPQPRAAPPIAAPPGFVLNLNRSPSPLSAAASGVTESLDDMPASAASSPSLTATSAPTEPDPIAADDDASTPVTPPTSTTPTAPATSSAARRKKKRRKAAAAAAAAAAVAAASSSSTVDVSGTSVTFTAELDSPDWTGIVRALSGLLGDSGAISSSSRTLTSLIPLLSGANDEVLSDLQALLRRDTQKLTAALREAGNGLMAALAGPSGSGEKPMMSAADLAALEAQVDAAKRETAMWEQELRRVMTRNRQAGLM